LSLDAATLAAVIVDCARRMAAWGITRLVLLSAHGGNGQALALAAERLRRELPALRVWLPEGNLAPDEAVLAVAAKAGIAPEEFGLHAGEGETSEVLWLHPDLVRAEAAEAGYRGDMTTIVETLQRVGLKMVTPNGVLGDPTRARADRGARYLDAWAGALAKELLA
jgi:creatinine amidohydrolase